MGEFVCLFAHKIFQSVRVYATHEDANRQEKERRRRKCVKEKEIGGTILRVYNVVLLRAIYPTFLNFRIFVVRHR
jgi:hypothetical protein